MRNYLIRSKIKSSNNYNGKYFKIKFELDDDLPLIKAIETHISTIGVSATFNENNKYYPQVFLDKSNINYKLDKNVILR